MFISCLQLLLDTFWSHIFIIFFRDAFRQLCLSSCKVAIFMPVLFTFFIYALFMREYINLTEILLLFSFWKVVHVALWVFELPVWTCENFLYFVLVHPLKAVVQSGVPLRLLQMVVIQISHSVRVGIIFRFFIIRSPSRLLLLLLSVCIGFLCLSFAVICFRVLCFCH